MSDLSAASVNMIVEEMTSDGIGVRRRGYSSPFISPNSVYGLGLGYILVGQEGALSRYSL